MNPSTAAFVGTAGGIGTTRLAVETGAALAAAGNDVIILDAAVDTQGLAGYVPGRIAPDIVSALLDEATLEEVLVEHPVEVPGRLACAPVHAPFVRVAAAKAPETAQRFEALVEVAAEMGDYVLVDVPPLASNTAVAAAAAVDVRGVVAPASDRGRDALARTRGSLADIGLAAGPVIANRVTGEPLADATVSVPQSRTTDVPETPACLTAEPGFGPAIGRVATTLFDVSLSIDLGGGLVATAREYLS
ncbi:MAG: ParA family protein [Halobacteriaceae archaeon]